MHSNLQAVYLLASLAVHLLISYSLPFLLGILRLPIHQLYHRMASEEDIEHSKLSVYYSINLRCCKLVRIVVLRLLW